MTVAEMEFYAAVKRIANELNRLNTNIEKFIEYANRNDKVDN